MKEQHYIYIILAMMFLGLIIICLGISYIRIIKNKVLSFIFNTGLSIIICYSVFKIAILEITEDPNILILVSMTPALFSMFYNYPKSDKVMKDKMTFVLEHEKGRVIYKNPYNGFLVYGGAEAGKTSSIGKPLLEQYMRNNFAGFIYDAKENDYTKTAMKIKENINYPYPIYNIDFIDPSRSYRVNPISPNIISIPQLVSEFATNFFRAQLQPGEKENEWVIMALSVFKAAFWRFYEDFPKFCTIPHICQFLLRSTPEQLSNFLNKNEGSKVFLSVIKSAEGSEKTYASIQTSLARFLTDFTADKNITYILTGDDFELNPLDPNNPKLITVSNHFVARELISPIVVLLFTTIAKQIRFGNKVPCMFFLDEATTFKIPKLETYPSELREYLVSFTILTQSASKIEKMYDKFDRSSLESNLSNQFYGWTGDTLAFDNYAKQFSKIIEQTKSRTVNTGRGGRSSTIGERKEVKYDGEFFGNLLPGEFVGKTKNANVKQFNTRFKQYDGGKVEEVPIIRNITKKDIEENYLKVIKEVDFLLDSIVE